MTELAVRASACESEYRNPWASFTVTFTVRNAAAGIVSAIAGELLRALALVLA